MPEYEWENKKTGEISITESYNVPPNDSGDWVRKFSFSAGSVRGAGGSPAKPSTSYSKGKTKPN